MGWTLYLGIIHSQKEGWDNCRHQLQGYKVTHKYGIEIPHSVEDAKTTIVGIPRTPDFYNCVFCKFETSKFGIKLVNFK